MPYYCRMLTATNTPETAAAPTAPLRVAICITGLHVGGAEVFLSELLKRAPDEFEIRVFSLIDGGPVAERITGLGIPVTGLHMEAGQPRLSALFELRRQFAEFQPDVVHTWMYHADLLGGVAAKLAGVRRVVWHLHNSDLSPERVRLMTRLVVRLNGLLSHFVPSVILSCSEAGARTHVRHGYSPKRLRVLPNGVDTQRFVPVSQASDDVREQFGLQNGSPLIGLVARVDPQKNHSGFFEAVRLFFQRGGDADFVLVGLGAEPGHTQAALWAQESGYADRVTLAGPRDDVPRLMAGFDVATSSSLGEAFPLVIIEAMACDVPCAVTDVGDSALMVADTGVVVPPDDASALADAWLELLAMPEGERQALGRRARERVLDNYSIEYIAERIWSVYRGE